MTANLPATTTRPGTLSSAPLSDRHRALLLGKETPIVGPETAAVLRQFAAEPEPPLAEREQVVGLVAELSLATMQGKMSEDEAGALLELYWRALKDVPLIDLRRGAAKLLKTCKFRPTPAEFRSAALHAGAPRKYAKSRARLLVFKHEHEWIAPLDPADIPTPEEIEEIKRAAAAAFGPKD